MRHAARWLVWLGGLAVAGPALGAAAEPDLVDRVRQNRQDLIASEVRAPADTPPATDLRGAAERLRAVVERPTRRAAPAAQILAAAVAAPPPSESPRTLSPEELAQLKDLSTKRVADPVLLADALFMGGHPAEADPLYERILADEATPKRTKAWALFQTANCRRRRDPAAAVALYARLVSQHADSPWVALAKTYQALLEWQQASEKAAQGAPAAAGPGSTQAPAATTAPAAPPAARGGA